MATPEKDFGVDVSPAAAVPAPGNEGPLVVDPEVVPANIHPDVHHQIAAADVQGQGQVAAPAVVNQLVNADENINTIIDPGKPEPGRDIFANGGGEVQSGTVPPPAHNKAGAAEEVKVISSVLGGAQNGEVERGLVDRDEEEGRKEDGREYTVATDLNLNGGTHRPKGIGKLENDAESSKDESKFWTEQQFSEDVPAAAVAETEATVAEAEAEAAGLELPMGPHDEAGEVREKVAEELFGDDVDE